MRVWSSREKSRWETETGVISIEMALRVMDLDQIRNEKGRDEDGEFSPTQGHTQEQPVHEPRF